MGDEVKVLTALKSGSEQAFERLYKQLSGKLYNFIMALSKGDEYIAEEIVQATFVKLWEIREQVDPQRSIHSFLTVIAKNMLMNRYQRQTVEFVYLEYLQKQGLSSDSTTEKEIDGKSLGKFIDGLIERLPPARKKIFLLSKKRDLSTREIAQDLDISVSTVETQLSLAKKFLREQLEMHRDKLFLIGILFVNFT